jgi:hypothetical protein
VAPSAAESTLDPISFDVSGSIGGQAISGKVTNGRLTVPCSGAGANQVTAVHWTGNAGNADLEGEIDFKPGSWTLGSASAQGVASVGLAGGKAADSLVATSGSVTTGASGGTIDGTFTGGADTLHLSGSWTCPAS